MGWEVRGGNRMYLYRNRRINGRPVKEYLASSSGLDFGELYSLWLVKLQHRQRRVRTLQRSVSQRFRQRIDQLIVDLDSANQSNRIIVEGLLYSIGFHKHKRGEWRMKRELKELAESIQRLQAQKAKPAPMVNCVAPKDDVEAVALFEQARNGDVAAQAQVHVLIRDRDLQDRFGDLGKLSTQYLIDKAASGDPIWKAGITEKMRQMRDEMLGVNPSILEELLVRRVLNGWVVVHALELEQTLRPPTGRRDREHLDKALSRAERRYMQAMGELARVRKLQMPTILAKLVG